ncbi:twitching motility protein PilT [Neisseria bacilliformis ATCC BAA-1200]|uniref:Twitching motility protein PilT n=1 Tax=Neisseria bacilliformis ATCC BAA-1200 TaxID=888742 RepID=F2BBF7_9NEIS|nr:twitching motility protein PilT [Neisseria bacilliformis ATCC BAA-1200]
MRPSENVFQTASIRRFTRAAAISGIQKGRLKAFSAARSDGLYADTEQTRLLHSRL